MTFGEGFLVMVALMALYGIITADMAIRDSHKYRSSPATMDDEAGINFFSFSDRGFKFSVSRSEHVACHINRVESAAYGTLTITKSYIMVDKETNMPFMVSLRRVKDSLPQVSEDSHVYRYRPIRNKIDMIDQLNNLNNAQKISEIELDSFVYQDDVLYDEDLMMVSQGVKAPAVV